MSELTAQQKAAVLVEALPWLRRFAGDRMFTRRSSSNDVAYHDQAGGDADPRSQFSMVGVF